MTSESSESSMDDASVSGGARRTGAPAIGKGALSSRSSGKYPLPGPWPGLQEPQPLAVDDDEFVIPIETPSVMPAPQRCAPETPRDVAPRDVHAKGLRAQGDAQNNARPGARTSCSRGEA